MKGLKGATRWHVLTVVIIGVGNVDNLLKVMLTSMGKMDVEQVFLENGEPELDVDG